MSKTEKEKNCFDHINKYWKPEYYFSCRDEWEKIKKFIVIYSEDTKEIQTVRCCCGTIWKINPLFFPVNDHEGICPACDTYSQPFLCNPINYDSVIKYINPVFHKYLLPYDFASFRDSEECKTMKLNQGDNT